MGAFISENFSTMAIGAVVLGIIAFALVRTILNLRKGRSPCGCDCEKCAAANKKQQGKQNPQHGIEPVFK
ncbi:MAG: FeoB-associated Cys-rich membrane protein [Spirochaetaceae bacterium]|jgi:hypothetical protein|nr:FeoB-associated Cys-rich membrane protein [Spirochaetaceae bacterium]